MKKPKDRVSMGKTNGEKRTGLMSGVRRGQKGKEERGYKGTEEDRSQKKGIK